MNPETPFHVVTLGWDYSIVEGLCNPVAAKSGYRFSHIVHPSHTPHDWPGHPVQPGIHFFRDDPRHPMPSPDRELLLSLEQDEVPTVHNMIMSDRVVSKVDYDDALSYATFLVRRMFELFKCTDPSVIIGGFDGIHGSLGCAVAKRMQIPWFALNYGVIPFGLACFSDRLSPAARVSLSTRSPGEHEFLAEVSLRQFEEKKLQAYAYVAAPSLSLGGKLARLPSKIPALYRTVCRSRLRKFLQFTEARSGHSVQAAVALLLRTARARQALRKVRSLTEPPAAPYVFFGLHMQPESSIDVWAPFFSNQMWVIELLSRSIPPTHKLLVKIHKSDIANYSRAQLERMRAFPGVELVAPFANTRSFIEKADLLISIQGTIGLEAALLGKPVIMLGDSPIAAFPNVSSIGPISDLPALMRRKLSEPPPGRAEIVGAYARFLAPFLPASPNIWTVDRTEKEINDYVNLFAALRKYVAAKSPAPHQASV